MHLNFKDSDVKQGQGGKFFEGVFTGVIVGQMFKQNESPGQWVRTESPDAYNNKIVWEIEIKLGAGKPQRISLFGGEPFEGRRHKWASLMINCGLDPQQSYPEHIIGKNVKVLMYAEKPTGDNHVWSRMWNVTFSSETEREVVESFFKKMLDSAGSTNRVVKNINPESKYMTAENTVSEDKEDIKENADDSISASPDNEPW